MISELDEYIGQIWQELERTNQLQNTLFIYTSDHGESLGEHGLWYKNNLYDVAARIPLVMAGPGFPKGVKVSTPVAHVDMVATILELSGAGIPATLRGHSLLPLMRGRSGDHPGFAYSESHSEGNCTGSFMIRKGDWKYLHFTWYDNLLFNVAQDPGEFNNRIHDPAAKRIKNELQEILRAQVDPEEVTQHAFSKQDKMLREMAKRMSEEELFALFKGRMGPGLARVLARSSKGMYRFHAQH